VLVIGTVGADDDPAADANAALKPLGWHVLRHTYASHLVMAGVALPVVQQLLGHTDIRLTMRTRI
jgi:site-specific recombinase XerD